METNSIKQRLCEANKKVSFGQRSPVEIKKAKSDGKFDYDGQSFSFMEGEVIEGALFERITRDCTGKPLRNIPVRRFRKTGMDEWFSVPANKANEYWVNGFDQVTKEDLVTSYENMIAEEDPSEMRDRARPQEEEEEQEETKPVEVEKAKKPTNGLPLAIFVGLMGLGIVLAITYNKKK